MQQSHTSLYEKEKNKYNKLVRNFCDSNCMDMINHFPYLKNHCKSISLSQYLSSPDIDLRYILKELSDFSENIFYYTSSINIENNMCFVGRITSPDFFIGMDNTEAFNLDNKFSHKLGIKKNKSKPLPFS